MDIHQGLPDGAPGASIELSRELMLSRARARDGAYNGRFLTGVLSTGIYCLPSCPARRPNEENVRFFFDESSARAARLRPCRRCRPDLFYRQQDPDLDLATGLAQRVRRDPGAYPEVKSLVATSGVGLTKLNALFRRHYHVTPAAFLQRVRVEEICRALLGGRRRILDLALDAGWDSSSAFHESFRRATAMTPGDYRRLGRGAEFVLDLPAGYRAAAVLRYLARDPESRCERVSPSGLTKAVRLAGQPALLAIDLGEGAARCRVERADGTAAAPPEMAAAHGIALRLLGLTLDPGPFERQVRRTRGARRLIAGREGLRIPLSAEPFEGLAWAIIGQQINLAFATTLRRRFVELCGEPAGGGSLGSLAHPTPEAVARLDVADLTARQFSGRKAEYLIGAAQAIATGELPLASFPERAATEVERRLLAVRGLGPWTAHYVMLRACGFADCLPVGDSGLAAGLTRFFALDHRPGPEETRSLMQPFTPYRSFATAHLWASLGENP
ncbi:MAG TPA: Ada metal-binding domain-containing protein [Thermoanaerobaculia bacterium]|nr:Ada metal-binding domain-containing protein [Thermoanaerobaculia bacterium]